MSTGLHLATIAFSVRNCLVAHGPSGPALITAILRQRWDSGVEESEVRKALAELKKRGFVSEQKGELFAAPGPIHTSRGVNGNHDLAVDDHSAWEGWV